MLQGAKRRLQVSSGGCGKAGGGKAAGKGGKEAFVVKCTIRAFMADKWETARLPEVRRAVKSVHGESVCDDVIQRLVLELFDEERSGRGQEPDPLSDNSEHDSDSEHDCLCELL
mmetsp:Transcript_160893/g.516353  ORF Transcript_160893/g.516353 Transcript_160893/m.516353 type:complete len:114 (-) Transcript_160893:120-461(-)